jgi:hypothetical protein
MNNRLYSESSKDPLFSRLLWPKKKKGIHPRFLLSKGKRVI